MNIRRIIRDWLYADNTVEVRRDRESTELAEDQSIIHCRLFSANNGHILEFFTYDSNDRRKVNRYIVDRNAPNLSETIGKYFAIELMR